MGVDGDFESLCRAAFEGRADAVRELVSGFKPMAAGIVDAAPWIRRELSRSFASIAPPLPDYQRFYNDRLWVPLLLAVGAGHVAFLDALLTERPEIVDWVASPKLECFAALHLASALGRVDVVKLLLARGADLLVRAKSLDTPAHVAARHGRTDVLRVLVDSDPACLRCTGRLGRLPLHAAVLAARRPHVGTVSFLVAACPESVRVVDGKTSLPLHYAALCQSPDVVRVVLGAWPEAVRERDDWGALPIHNVCGYGVRLLYDAWPESLHELDADGCTPVHATTRYRIEGEVRAFVAASPEALRVRDAAGQTLLEHTMACAGDYEDSFVLEVLSCYMPLGADDWRLVPSPLDGVGRLFGKALTTSARDSREVVARLPRAERDALRASLPCLRRRLPSELVLVVARLVVYDATT